MRVDSQSDRRATGPLSPDRPDLALVFATSGPPLREIRPFSVLHVCFESGRTRLRNKGLRLAAGTSKRRRPRVPPSRWTLLGGLQMQERRSRATLPQCYPPNLELCSSFLSSSRALLGEGLLARFPSPFLPTIS